MKNIYRCKNKKCRHSVSKPDTLCDECKKKEKIENSGRLWITQNEPKNTA